MLIGAIVYILSVIWLRHELIRYYKYEMSILKPGLFDVAIVFMPVVNTTWALLFFLTRKPRHDEKKTFTEKLADKFFGNSKDK